MVSKSKGQEPAKFISEGSASEDDLPETPATSSAPPAPRHDPADIELAEYYGFTRAEAEAMSPDQLVRQIGRMQRFAEQRDRTILNNMRPQPQARPEPPPPPQEENFYGDDEDENSDDGGITYVKRKTTDKDLHPAITRKFRQMADELKALKEKYGVVDGLKQHVEQQVVETRNQAIDAGFSDLGPEYTGVFGDGGLADLEDGSPELAFRNMVLGRVIDHFKKAGKTPTLNQLRRQVAAEGQKQFDRIVRGRGREQDGSGDIPPTRTGPRYAGDGDPVRKSPPPRPFRPGTTQFMSDAEIARDAEERRVRKMYEEGGSEKPAARGAPKPKPSRENAVNGVEELMRSWGDAEPEDEPTNGFVP